MKRRRSSAASLRSRAAVAWSPQARRAVRFESSRRIRRPASPTWRSAARERRRRRRARHRAHHASSGCDSRAVSAARTPGTRRRRDRRGGRPIPTRAPPRRGNHRAHPHRPTTESSRPAATDIKVWRPRSRNRAGAARFRSAPTPPPEARAGSCLVRRRGRGRQHPTASAPGFRACHRDRGLRDHRLDRSDQRVATEQSHEPRKSGRRHPPVFIRSAPCARPARGVLLMEAQRREVLDRALIRKLQPDVGGLDLRDGLLPAARVAQRVPVARLEHAAGRHLGDLLVGGEQVVLQADLPLLARGQVRGDAQRYVCVRHAARGSERPDQTAADKIVVLVTRLEAGRAHPPRVQVGASLPRAVADLEQVREVTLECDLEEHRHRCARVRVERDVFMHLVQADQTIERQRHACLAHVATRARDAVGDHMPARVAKRKPYRRHRVGPACR